MGKCQRCKSTKVASLYGKCSDLSNFSVQDYEEDGYVKEDVGIGGGDDISFDYCLECGQIQGEFPVNTDFLDSSLSKYCPQCKSRLHPSNCEDDWWECKCGACGDNSGEDDYDTWLDSPGETEGERAGRETNEDLLTEYLNSKG